MVRPNNPFKVNGMTFRKEGLNFRICDHDCVTLNACSRSLAVNKYLHMETKEKNLMYTRNKRAIYLVVKSISPNKRAAHEKSSLYNPRAETRSFNIHFYPLWD